MSFAEYMAHGWKLCAIPPGTKGPRTPGWNKPGNEARVITTGGGAGLLHAYNGTCAIDVDNYAIARAWLAEHDIDLDALLTSTEAVQISSGREGRAKLLYALPAPLASVNLAPYEGVNKAGKPETYYALEFRCATADGLTVQDVLPPSIHPETGRPYEWKYGDDLLGHWSRLAPLPAAMQTIWQAGLSTTRAAASSGPVAIKGAEFPELEALLKSQDPNGPYADWLRVGMALHHETKGDRAGLALWNNWSMRSHKYKDLADLDTHWRSFKFDANNAVTIGGLRREVISAPEEFPIVPVSTTPEPLVEDTRPKAVLEHRLAFVVSQELYYDLEAASDTFLSDRAIKHLFCPLMKPRTGDDGKTKRADPVAFLMNSKTKLVVDAVGVHPGAGRFYTEDGCRYVNRYVPRVIEPLHPKMQERDAFDFMWSRMKDPVFREWLMKFYAHAVQRPGIKMQTAPLLFSAAQGTGKNTIAKTLPELLFGHRWVRTMSGNVLGGQFNDVLGETWWLYLEELRSGATKADRIMVSNKIKTWVTDSTLEVHPKGLKAYNMRNRIQLIATSNFDDAVQIDNNDRRWAICELGDPLTEKEALDLYAFLDSPRAPGVLQHIFRGVNLVGFSPTARAPNTWAKKAMIAAGIGNRESKMVEGMVAGVPPFDRDLLSLEAVRDFMIGSEGLSVQALARMMKQPPFSCVMLKGAITNVWCWRNVAFWRKATNAERMAHVESGIRPSGSWNRDIPPAIRALSAEGGDEPEDLQDLLS